MHVTRRRTRADRHRHDRVPDELARTVIGNVPAAIGATELGTDARRIHENVLRIGAHSERVHVSVLEEQEPVIAPFRPQAPLEGESVLVADASQPSGPQEGAAAHSSVAQSRPSRMVLISRMNAAA